jgi:hypothetical protein
MFFVVVTSHEDRGTPAPRGGPSATRRSPLQREEPALRKFEGETLVSWSPDTKVMPPEHGPRLAELLPRAQYAEIPGAFVLPMLDEPRAVAREIAGFLRSPAPAPGPEKRLLVHRADSGGRDPRLSGVAGRLMDMCRPPTRGTPRLLSQRVITRLRGPTHRPTQRPP